MKRARKRRSLTAVCALGAAALAVGAAAPGAAQESAALRAGTGSGGYLAPYFTTGDLTGDDAIEQDDLDLLVASLGTASTDAAWSTVAAADYDDDGAISMSDVADLSQRIVYDDGPFALLEASALDMQKAMNAGVVTSVELTQDYLDRIAAYDTLADATHARPLNSIITTSDAALAAAASSDAARTANGGPRSMVDGIPVIVKDNYDTLDMPTSAGHGSWETNQTEDDAFMVDGLRDAGAVILAKATLDEFAFGFASEYTAGVPAGQSELVASPYVLARTAGGSSGGTGASIAANLGGIGFGTDTGGSIRVPASYNQLVGIRPTVGLASRDGIVPLALSQDTGGPITRSVSDAAIALDTVTGVDPADTITAQQLGRVPASYTSFLDPDALEDKRIGYVTSMVPTNNATTQRLFAAAVADLTAQGATVVPITTTALNATLAEPSGSTNEFEHDLDIYIAEHLDPDVTTRTLGSIVASGRLVPSRVTTYASRDNVTPAQYDTWIGSHGRAIATGERLTTGLMDENELDALIYPSGNPYSTFSTNLRLSPNTGMPSLSVPMGQATDGEAIPGAGVNLEFLGRNYSEGELIGLAYDFEQATTHRTTPALYPALAGE